MKLKQEFWHSWPRWKLMRRTYRKQCMTKILISHDPWVFFFLETIVYTLQETETGFGVLLHGSWPRSSWTVPSRKRQSDPGSTGNCQGKLQVVFGFLCPVRGRASSHKGLSCCTHISSCVMPSVSTDSLVAQRIYTFFYLVPHLLKRKTKERWHMLATSPFTT